MEVSVVMYAHAPRGNGCDDAGFKGIHGQWAYVVPSCSQGPSSGFDIRTAIDAVGTWIETGRSADPPHQW